MKIQVLVATMNQKDYSLLEKMNIQTDAIICNQCDCNKFEEFEFRGHNIKWLSFSERGVGLNRNNALMRANADVVLFADDDMVYRDGYPQIVENMFNERLDADVVIFDLTYPNKDRKPIKKIEKLNRKKCMRFGAARISARLSSLKYNGIFFNLCFGGGSIHCSGEDTLFLNECINRKLTIYSCPIVIADLKNERDSTWFKGYDDKFFFDKGVIYLYIFKSLTSLAIIFHCIKHRNRYKKYGCFKSMKQMLKGAQFAKNQ